MRCSPGEHHHAGLRQHRRIFSQDRRHRFGRGGFLKARRPVSASYRIRPMAKMSLPRVRGFATDLLGRHSPPCPGHVRGWSRLQCSGGLHGRHLSQAKSRMRGPAVPRNEDVFRLQIAMHDSGYGQHPVRVRVRRPTPVHLVRERHLPEVSRRFSPWSSSLTM